MVNRYHVEVGACDGGTHRLDFRMAPDGAHVKASDYDALAARLAEAELRITLLSGCIGCGCGGDCGLCTQCRQALDGAADSAEANPQPPASLR